MTYKTVYLHRIIAEQDHTHVFVHPEIADFQQLVDSTQQNGKISVSIL
jgi:hypothetical protein